jgi:hypothetical protein
VSYELREGQGSLHANEAKSPENKQPDFTGKLCLNGVTYRLAGWKYVTGRGRHWLSLKAELPRAGAPDGQHAAQPTQAASGSARGENANDNALGAAPQPDEFGDELPFAWAALIPLGALLAHACRVLA